MSSAGSQGRRKEGRRGQGERMAGRKEGKTLSAENLHVFGQVKVLSLGKGMSGT